MQEPVASKHCIALDGELCYHIPLLYLDYLVNVSLKYSVMISFAAVFTEFPDKNASEKKREKHGNHITDKHLMQFLFFYVKIWTTLLHGETIC